MTKMTKKLNVTLVATLVAAAMAIPSAMADDRGGRGGKGGKGGKGQRIEKMFERIDANQDGVLSLTEMTDPVAEKAAKKLARKDADEDGFLTAEELQSNRHGNTVDLSAIAAEIVQCVTDLKAQTQDDNITVPDAASFVSAEARFDALDSSDDGLVDLAELEAGGLVKANDAFTNMDADADGSVTKDEFVAAHQSRRATKKAIRQCVQELTDDGEV